MRVVEVFYEVVDEKIIINIVKQEKGNKIVERIESSHLPYFYTKQKIEHPLIVKTESVNAMNGEFFKNYVQYPSHVREVREYLRGKKIETWEADIPYSRRWLIDNDLNCGDEILTKVYIDVEVDSPLTRFPDFDKDRVLSIAIYDGKCQKVFHIDDYSSERELLIDFLDNIKEYSMIVGWNLSGFDLPYLVRRFVKNNLGMRWVKFFVWIDLMDLYKRFVTSYSKQVIATSYSLDAVSRLELNEAKIDKKEVLKSKNKEQVIEYNLRDAELTYKIDKKLKLTDLIDSFSLISNLPPSDCLYFSKIITLMVLRSLKGVYIFKNSKSEEYVEPYKGAWVLDTPVGMIENVAVFDFASLYPNIIKTFNISIETETTESDAIRTPNNKFFTKKFEGTYSKIISFFMDLREKYKKMYKETKDEVYNVLQIGCKFLNASFYGVLGFSAGRIYSRELAETITATGRWLLQQIVNELKNNKYDVVSGDTDSVMVKLKTNNLVEEALKLQEEINNFLQNIVQQFNVDKNFLKMKVEYIFGKVYFYGKKKRYFGKIVWKDGEWVDELLFRGLEIKRSDWSKIAVMYEENLVKKMLEGVEEACIFHKDFLSKLRFQPIEYFVIYKGLNRPIDEYVVKPPHVRVAKEGDFVGDKIGYIVTNMNARKVERWEEGKIIKPDYDYYVKKQILPIYERLLRPLIQTNLKSFLR